MILEIKHLTKKFGGLTALDNINFGIEDGKVLGLIGPNGAGKTTLFNCVCGLLPISGGEIVFQNQVISGLPTYKVSKAGIARAFQIVKPFGNMTALENAMVGAFNHTKRYDDSKRTALEALDKVFLSKQANVVAKMLNLGERKKLEIAKALATGPKLLLLDEVMAGLTPPEVQEMLKVIRTINQSGVTIMLIEHIMEAIMNVSDNIVVISFGVQIAEGIPEEVANNKQVIEAYFGVEEGEADA